MVRKSLYISCRCNSSWLCQQAESNPGPLTWQVSTLPVHQRGNLITYTACSTSLCYILPCQISVHPRTPGTVSTIRVLTTTQLLYNIKSPHHEDSHSFSHPSLFGLATVTLIKEPFPTSLLSYMSTIPHVCKQCCPLVTTIPHMYRHYCPVVVPFWVPL